MTLEDYKREIRFRLTGGILNLELDDNALDQLVSAALREIQRYICIVATVTVPYQECITVKDWKVNSVINVMRSESIGNVQENTSIDPMYLQQWQMLSMGTNMQNFMNYMYNYASWSSLEQIRNTVGTDMNFYYDKPSELLYVYSSSGTPQNITIQFVPRFDSVEQITSDFWIDMLMRLCVALAKVTVGRIRTRYTQSNALWANDTAILEEGNQELNALREKMEASSQLLYPLD